MLTTSIGTVRGKMQPGVTPSVSVIVPCYNGGRFLPQLLASLARQTFRDFEIIIVDDGSTDAATRQALDTLDPSVHVIRQANKGLSAARNAGIAAAAADLVLTLDCDDTAARILRMSSRKTWKRTSKASTTDQPLSRWDSEREVTPHSSSACSRAMRKARR